MTDFPEGAVLKVPNDFASFIKVEIEKDGIVIQGKFISLKEIKGEIVAINQDIEDMKAHRHTGDLLEIGWDLPGARERK